MGERVMIMDNPRRGERQVRDLGAVCAYRTYDLYEEVAPICEIYATLIDRRPFKSPMPTKALAVLEDTVGPFDRVLVTTFRPIPAAIDA